MKAKSNLPMPKTGGGLDGSAVWMDYTLDLLTQICQTKTQLKDVPVIANVDFGHTLPIITFPIGGRAFVEARGETPALRIVW